MERGRKVRLLCISLVIVCIIVGLSVGLTKNAAAGGARNLRTNPASTQELETLNTADQNVNVTEAVSVPHDSNVQMEEVVVSPTMVSIPTNVVTVSFVPPAYCAERCDNIACMNGGKCINVAGGGLYDPKCYCPIEWTGDHCETKTACFGRCKLNNAVCVLGDEHTNGYKCYCPRAWWGEECEKVSPCFSSPNVCLNDGICSTAVDPVEHLDGFTCSCTAQWGGPTCNTKPVCADGGCANYGVCPPDFSSFPCTCAQGWYGQNCDIQPPNLTCLNGGRVGAFSNTEVKSVNDFQCICQGDFRGDLCEIPTACASNNIVDMCQNAGVCNVDASGKAYCACSWSISTGISISAGEYCEILNPCSKTSPPCKNGASCEFLGSKGYACHCRDFYYGAQCELKRQLPSSNLCMNESKMLYDSCNAEGYHCECYPVLYDKPVLWTGKNCDVPTACNPNPCNGGFCNVDDSSRGYTCTCDSNLRTGDNCEISTLCDINTCANGGTCMLDESEKGYTCTCTLLWTGGQCTLPSACNPDPCAPNGECSLSATNASGFACTCSFSYDRSGVPFLETWTGDLCENGPIPLMCGVCPSGSFCDEIIRTCFCYEGAEGDDCRQPKSIVCGVGETLCKRDNTYGGSATQCCKSNEICVQATTPSGGSPWSCVPETTYMPTDSCDDCQNLKPVQWHWLVIWMFTIAGAVLLGRVFFVSVLFRE